MMKKILYIAVALLTFCACGKDNGDGGGGNNSKTDLNITGDWRLSKIETKASIGGAEVDVYLRFTSDKKFEMYQMIGTGRYRAYSGTWTLTGSVLSGTYSDGKKWGASYDVAVSGSTLTLTSKTSNPEKDTYTKSSIPASVINDAIE